MREPERRLSALLSASRTFLVIWLSLASSALGASVSGRITSGASGVDGMEVRLWGRTSKGHSFLAPTGRLVTTAADGSYAFTNVPAGTYKLDTRMAPTMSGNYGDRWYDVAPPSSGGYAQQDADDLVLLATDDRMGIDIEVEMNGGLEGRTLHLGAPLGGLTVRLESLDDLRVHHNDASKTVPASRVGEHSFRGMRPGSYRLVVHDPNSVYADVVGTTHTIAAAMNGMAGDMAIPLAPVDGFEPNNSFDAGLLVDVSPIRMRPAAPVNGAGLIAPRNSGDVDFYCWNALDGERYMIFAVATFGTLLDGGVRESPWVDPVLSFWRGGVKVAEDDDSGPLNFDARLDTGVVSAGPVCVAVTTFGDSMWQGQNQASAGAYSVRLEMGNRAPTLALSYASMPAPTPPTAVTLIEGNTVTIGATYSDPEGNPLTSTWTLVNAQGQTIASGNLPAGGTGSIPFVASQSSGRGSPYTLTVRVADAEFDATRTVRIEVSGVNNPPTTPTALSPDGGSIIRTSRPPLVCRESSDDDADPLRYEFELGWQDGGLVLQAETVAGNDAGIDPDGGVYGLITFVPLSLPENARLWWRVRAFDGNLLSGYSGWSDPWNFVVDVTNEPPDAPVLLKPVDGEELMVRRPTLEVSHPTDPEGDFVSFIFEIARDTSFLQLVAQSPQVPSTSGASATMWTADADLEWGVSYSARAIAIDGRGARSQPSQAHRFTVRGNTPPMTVSLGAPFSTGLCNGQIFLTAPTSLVIPPINDVEQDAVMVEVQIARAADSLFMMPVFQTEVRANATADTTIGLDTVRFEEDATYLVRARSRDGQATTEWVSCSFTLDAVRGAGDGGVGGKVSPKPCGCSSALGPLVGLVWVLLRRRRSGAPR